ncbi:transcriptional regulator [Niabella ginsenosidivorans]|uniref:Transcriptional regulator n=1 Tax=Niabella ginsenosidivorans TaxID=1176587 RepID=A0A1A9HWP4_9BACT|nr:LysR substrate-binding domain-containing protein [Niabella ginsenosidivorans]ANH79828.1 transcriptional regulator [Niabella ginsenosidivorans]
MEDFRLKVFHSVARNKSFTKAAAELLITQPAVTKQVKNLEELLETRLFERVSNSVVMTQEGELLFRYTNEIFQLYKEFNFELSVLKAKPAGSFTVGASTTIAQYLISPVLGGFQKKFPEIRLNLMSGNTEAIENAVLSKSISLGIVEGKRHHTGLKYAELTSDELVLVTHAKSRYAKEDTIELDELKKMPMVLRERGSGTLEVIEIALQERNISLADLPVIMHLGGTESIKSFLENSHSVAFISMHAIHKEIQYGELKIIHIRGFRIMRHFSFIYLHGQPDKFSTMFMRYTRQHYKER